MPEKNYPHEIDLERFYNEREKDMHSPDDDDIVFRVDLSDSDNGCGGVDMWNDDRNPDKRKDQGRLERRFKKDVAYVVKEFLEQAMFRCKGGEVSKVFEKIKEKQPLHDFIDRRKCAQQLSFSREVVDALRNGKNRDWVVSAIKSAIRSLLKVRTNSDFSPSWRNALKELNEQDINYIADFILELITETIPSLRVMICRKVAECITASGLVFE